MGGYTATTFNSGNPPGIDAAFLNAFQAWIQQTEGDIGSVAITGTTAGTATMYQFLQGTLKGFFIYFNGYRNSTATEQKITLPTAFTAYALFWANGGIPGCHIYSGATQLTGKFEKITTLASAGNPGGITTESQMYGFSSGDILSGFDGLGCGVSQSQAFTAGLLVIGI